MSGFRDIAHLVEGQVESEQLRAELTTRPLRLAFVIRDDLTLNHLAKVLEYNSVIWGGYHNALVPTNGEKIERDWWINLIRHRPDKVVFCGDRGNTVVSPELVKAVTDGIQPFSCCEWDQWEKDVVELHKTGRQDQIGSIPMLYLLQYLVESLHRPIEQGRSNVRIPRIAPDHPFYACVAAHVGVIRDLYEEGARESLGAECVDFESSDPGEYFAQLAEFDGRLYPLSLTHQYLGMTTAFEGSGRPRGLSIVLIDRNWVQDICVFWNLRLAPSLKRFGEKYQELLLPIDSLGSPRNLGALASALTSDGPWHTHRVTLLSESADRRRLRRLADRLRRELGGGVRVEISPAMPLIADFRVYNTTERDEILLEDGFFSFKAPQPEFGDYIKAGQWTVDVDFKDRSNRSHEFPHSSKLNYLLCCAPSAARTRLAGGYWVRYAQRRLAFLVDRHTGFTGGCLPKAPDAFRAVFDDRGFTAALSDKHPYAEGLSALLGSPRNIKLLEEPGVRNLLWHMRTGRACTYEDMAPTLRLGQDCEPVVAKLVQRGILLRGMSFRCEACHLLRWYPMSQIGETMECAGCLKTIQPPVRAPISFKLNELVARAVDQGSIPVLLTQRLLSTHTIKHALALFGIEVTKEGRQVDVDFMTTYEGYLLLAECKEFKNGVAAKQIRETIEQLSNLVKVAIDVGAPVVLLSTLLPDTPPELAQRVLRLNRSREVAVHLVSLKEMKLVNLCNPAETIDFDKVDLFYPPKV
jgi:hypothetical protein